MKSCDVAEIEGLLEPEFIDNTDSPNSASVPHLLQV